MQTNAITGKPIRSNLSSESGHDLRSWGGQSSPNHRLQRYPLREVGDVVVDELATICRYHLGDAIGSPKTERSNPR